MPSPHPPRLPPKPPSQPAHTIRPHVPTPAPGKRKIRPLVYAIGIAGIVGSGALIGAYLKTGQQQEAAKKTRQSLLEPQAENARQQIETTSNTVSVATYAKSLEMLESRRSQLFAQKTGLETKLRDFRESQQRKAEEEREKKEFGLKR